MRIPLFVKKSNAEGNDFYYLGNMSVINDSAIEKMIMKDDGDKVTVVEMNFTLHSPSKNLSTTTSSIPTNL
jgi:hypothetical protein